MSRLDEIWARDSSTPPISDNAAWGEWFIAAMQDRHWLLPQVERLRSALRVGILEHHYGGSAEHPHRGLLPGDNICTCQEGYCPEWWSILAALESDDERA